MPVVDTLAPQYRYVLTDLVTNTVLGELPFSGVSYGCGLKAAGSFSGSTPVVLGKTNGYDLYETTMPGRTGLYVMRNDVCVWGGIIWSRNYDLQSRSMNVTGQEFTSYLHHRSIWKTYTSDYGATAVAHDNGVGVADYIDLTLNTGLAVGTLSPGSTVQLFFSGTGTGKYDQPYKVISQLGDKLLRVEAQVAGVNINFIRLAGKVVTAWTNGKHGFKKGDKVRVSGTGKDLYDGVKTISSVGSVSTFSYTVSTKNTKTNKKEKSKGKVSAYDKVTIGTYTGITVRIRTDTYDYVKSLLNAVFSDFNGIEFAVGNEPGVSYALTVTGRQLVSNVATINTEEPHGLAVGQQVLIRNLHSSLNGQFEVTATPTDSSFQYQRIGLPPVAYAAVTPNEKIVSKRRRSNLLATLTTTVAHGYSVGDIITVSGVDPTSYKNKVYDGTFTISSVGGTTTFSYSVANNDTSKTDEKGTSTTAGVTVTPNGSSVLYQQAVVGSGGSFPNSANVGIVLEADTYSGVDVKPTTFRGGAASNVGDSLTTYADSIDGFEYRIDCDYNADLQQFTRTFRLLEIDVPNPPDAGEVSPISRFGADKLVFEYPGNIAALNINESAENAATRMFVTGDTAGAQGNPYYAAAAAVELLSPQNGSRAWPLLDGVQSMSSQADQVVLYGYAERYLREARPPVMDFTINTNGSIDPVIGTFKPGDWCSVVVQDDFVQARMNNSLEPRNTALVRKIQAFDVSVPDGVAFPEIVTLKLVPEWQVDVSAN